MDVNFIWTTVIEIMAGVIEGEFEVWEKIQPCLTDMSTKLSPDVLRIEIRDSVVLPLLREFPSRVGVHRCTEVSNSSLEQIHRVDPFATNQQTEIVAVPAHEGTPTSACSGVLIAFFVLDRLAGIGPVIESYPKFNDITKSDDVEQAVDRCDVQDMDRALFS